LKVNKQNEIKLKELESEIKEITTGLNSELNIICQWIETYLGVYFDKSIEIPDLSITVQKSIKNNTKVDKLKEVLYTTRRCLNEELFKSDKNLKELKNDLSVNIKRQEKMIKEISDLKSDNLSKVEEIYSLKNDLKNINTNNSHNKDNTNKIRNEYDEKIEKFNLFCEKIYNSTHIAIEKIKSNKSILNKYPEHIYSQFYSESIVSFQKLIFFSKTKFKTTLIK